MCHQAQSSSQRAPAPTRGIRSPNSAEKQTYTSHFMCILMEMNKRGAEARCAAELPRELLTRVCEAALHSRRACLLGSYCTRCRQSPRLALDANDSRDTRASRARSGHEGCPVCPVQAPAGEGGRRGLQGRQSGREAASGWRLDTVPNPAGTGGGWRERPLPRTPARTRAPNPSLAADSQFLKVACATCLPGRKPLNGAQHPLPSLTSA